MLATRKDRFLYALKYVGICILFFLSSAMAEITSLGNFVDKILNFSGFSIIVFLLICWFVRIEKAVIQKSIRRYMISSALLTLFWYVIRTIKFNFFQDPDLIRYLWYCYYIPIIFLPLFAFYSSFCVGKSEGYKIPLLFKSLYIVAGVLILFVFTNDIHQLIFRFDKGFELSNEYYHHYFMYYIIVIWVVILTFSGLSVLYFRCSVPEKRSKVWIPFLSVFIAMVYLIAYYVDRELVFFQYLDFTTLCCGVIYGIWNSCISVGFISSNSIYDGIFENSTICTAIFDSSCKRKYKTNADVHIDKNILKSAVNGTVTLDKDTLLKSRNIKGGYVFWLEDISSQNKVITELKDTKELLQGENDLLNANIKINKKSAKVKKKLELYTMIYKDINHKFEAIDILLAKLQKDKSDSYNSLAEICFLSAFIKRRSNLILLSEKTNVVPLRELALCIKESLNYLSLFNVSCNVTVSDEGKGEIAVLMQCYDWFQNCIEKYLKNLLAVYVIVSQKDSILSLSVTLENKDNEINTLNNNFQLGGESFE